MSKQYPECPLFNHENCKEFYNRNVCALVRKDKVCLRNIPKVRKKAQKRKEPKETVQKGKSFSDKPIKEITSSTRIGL